MSTNAQVRAVIWDFDGPIVDTLTSGMRIVEALAAEHGLPFTEEIKTDLVRKWGLKGCDLISTCFGLSKEDGLAFYRRWSDHPDNTSSRLSPGARKALRELREIGVLNTMLTSRPSWSLDPALKAKRLARYFDRINTTCNTEFHKPDPRAFNCTLEMLGERGISKEECVFIGDTYIDIEAGSECGIRTFIVRTGPYGYFEPENFDPDHLIKSAGHLPGRLRHLDLLQ